MLKQMKYAESVQILNFEILQKINCVLSIENWLDWEAANSLIEIPSTQPGRWR